MSAATSPYGSERELKAAAKDLAKRLEEQEDNRLMCRGLRHAWDLEENFHVHEVKGTKTLHLRRTFRCMRDCGVRVIEIFIQTRYNGIERIHRYTDYTGAAGYLMPGVPRGVKPLHIIQQEQYRRAMEQVAGAARGDRERGDR
jgi:hypothetical protein